MAGTQPVAVYALRIPPGDIMVPAVPQFAAMFRLTMAAIDPSEEPELDAADSKQKCRATLKVVRVPQDMLDDDDDSDDYEDIDDEEDSDEEGVNGGPSSKKPKLALDEDDDDDDMEEDDDEDDDDDVDEEAAQAMLAKIMAAAKGKGKSKALDDGDLEDDEDSDIESLGMDECVLCTLDADKQYQQPLDFVVAEGEKVFFKVSGNLTVHLTGNYVMPIDEPSDDEEDEDYDLSPDEDEIDGLEALLDGGDESDELDDLEDPRIMEVDSEDEAKVAPAPPAKGKGKNKRPAEDDEADISLDSIIAKAQKDEAAESQPKKLSKAERKAAKKLKNNEGEAATPPQDKKAATQTNGAADSGKKVQFAKNLEQGPTPSKADVKPEAKAKAEAKTDDKKSSSPGSIRDVQGVTVDERKVGTGPAAKKGSKLEMRYIGKLDNQKVFDSNKSGKPFSFKLGVGEVIKGWDVGLIGIQTGGERRIIVPAHMAYGKKALPGIPSNSRLTFDIKCLAVK